MKFFLVSKKIPALAALLLLLSHFAFAQVPSGMNYQAVVRDGQQVLANQLMNVAFTLYKDSAEVYKETQVLTSSEHGLINAVIGEGVSSNGSIDSLDWDAGNYTLKVSIDNGGGFEDLGEMPMTSVPFSKTADRALSLENHNIFTENGNVGINTTSPSRELTVKGTVEVRDNTSGSIGTRIRGTGDTDVFGDNGNYNVYIGNPSSSLPDNGFVGVYNSSGSQRGSFQVNSTGTGGITLKGANGNNNTVTGFNGSAGNHGYIGAYNDGGGIRSDLYASTSNTGILGTYGPNGNRNATMSWLSGNNNNGFVTAKDAGGTTQAGLYVNSSGDGVVFGDVKNFRMDHPTQPGKEIWYACIEGPEAAAYERGTAKLVSGKAKVDFSDHFKMVASTQGMTVILTPLSGASEGLAVTLKSETGFEVSELRNGTGNYDFDWEVKVIRKGYENYRVIRNASETIPGDEAEELIVPENQ